MGSSDVELLKIYVLVMPFLIFCVGCGVYWLTGWMDRREDVRRRTANRPADWGAHTNP